MLQVVANFQRPAWNAQDALFPEIAQIGYDSKQCCVTQEQIGAVSLSGLIGSGLVGNLGRIRGELTNGL